MMLTHNHDEVTDSSMQNVANNSVQKIALTAKRRLDDPNLPKVLSASQKPKVRLTRFEVQKSVVFAVLLSFYLTGSVGAQTVSDEYVKTLHDQGFVIVSTGYTWLRRIVIHASNGTYEREIVIARGSGQILQDNWTLIKRPLDAASERNHYNQPVPPGPAPGGQGPGPGPGGQGGAGPGGQGGPGGGGPGPGGGDGPGP
jgi:hypothetical protein